MFLSRTQLYIWKSRHNVPLMEAVEIDMIILLTLASTYSIITAL